MNSTIAKNLNNAILKLLRPLVHIMLSNGISYHVFSDLARWVYVDIAFKEFGIPRRKQTSSRVSVITGLSRKEVQKLRELDIPADEEAHGRYNRATRVISGWIRDPLFSDNDNNPLNLALEGDVSFSVLVKKYSGDMPVRAVLDELLNIGAVALQEDGSVKLMTRAYLPGDDKKAKLDILGADVADLITTINHNLNSKNSSPFFQRKVSYDNIPAEFLEQFKIVSSEESQALLENLDKWLAARDRDVSPDVQGSGRKRVGLGIYYFEEDIENIPTQEKGENRCRANNLLKIK
ncbi:MAG: DUF6502 family protein [Syntrophales bacterium]|jgi:hypothetical protein|nr:DUF6502 family protein [Syntrophales bacterium]